MSLGSDRARAVAIVTGGSSQKGREVARELAMRSWSVVIVYLHDQWRAEATVRELIEAGGTTVAVRADLADDLDMQRLFTEAIAAFGGVDVVAHTTSEGPGTLYEQAARYVRQHGAIIGTVPCELITPRMVSALRERGITVAQMEPENMLSFLDSWLQQSHRLRRRRGP